MLVDRWLWGSTGPAAALARAALVPPSMLFRFLSSSRVFAYQHRLLSSKRLSVPTVAVGGISVGGAGKTPLAAWIASHYAELGYTPGVVLRGYGGDEGIVHRRLVPKALVVENADRVAGSVEAVSMGADLIVLDDAFQRLDVERDLNIAIVSAESLTAPRWTLPAGPWREGWNALRRANLVVVTRKQATRAVTADVRNRVAEFAGGISVTVAHLRLVRFHGLLSGEDVEPAALNGKRLLVSAGIADPDTFAAQCSALGAEVSLVRWRDHHDYSREDVGKLVELAGSAEHLIVTEKDAVKLDGIWPEREPEPLVADLRLSWESGDAEILDALDSVAKGATTKRVGV